jgi:anti-sigma factor RsiW
MNAINDGGRIHDEVQELLPWYITDTLAPDERRRVEDHVSACDLCRADLVRERLMSKGIADMPIDVELGWAAMRRRIEADAPRRRTRPWTRFARGIADRPRTVHLVLVAQLILLVSAIVAFAPVMRPVQYHALGSAPVVASANMLIMFQPDTRQQAVGQLLNEAQARIVDGPTVTGALLVHVAPDRRAATLERLKARREIALAEPIDR